MRHVLASVSLIVGLALPILAQERIPAGPPANGPTFDVVSIKRVTDIRTRHTIGEQPGGRFVISGVAIAAVIGEAYPSDTSDLIGAPDWVGADFYDLTAQAGRDVPREEMQLMLRAMLAERFKLAVHYELRERPVYDLVLARADGRLGPEIKRSDLDCDAIQTARRAASKEPPPATSNGAPACGTSMHGGDAGSLQLLLGARPLSALATMIRSATERVVIDKTGLKGNYDVTLKYTLASDPPPGAAPNIFTALQEQLGLKLQSDRAPLKVLVVDRIERPAEN
jgi:uncharacterized protein (TIGR03435 family)